nr:immunoglobulin light chain junction region [Macaca mulatta]MOV61108.1 immunoglobulin light chain junction region [Macaca mulatta]MOV61165.1 immunoglobulin light chain junction region [Macaca mulatta]MOV61212.1 immunoglobulin light chain junction region [Macaca mulatta]MOV61230.1 immunoglobulin light chain junction region [Macaca mulatta]
CMQHKALPWTF